MTLKRYDELSFSIMKLYIVSLVSLAIIFYSFYMKRQTSCTPVIYFCSSLFSALFLASILLWFLYLLLTLRQWMSRLCSLYETKYICRKNGRCCVFTRWLLSSIQCDMTSAQ
jgi:hypothetical protein